MANEYFQPGSIPAPNSPGSSAIMRQEFASIAAGFDKLPILAGHAGELVTVDGTGTRLVTSGAVIGDYVTKDGVETLTNKTMDFNLNSFIGLNFGMIGGVLPIFQGGTGAQTLSGAQQALGINLKANSNNAVLTGAPSAPTPPTGDASTRIATTFFVSNTIQAIGALQPANELPLMDGVAAIGVATSRAALQDHVHPSDTSRAPASAGTAAGTTFAPAGTIAATDVQAAIQELDTEKAPLASPTFTGNPQAPSLTDPSNSTDSIATTQWVQTRLVQLPVGVQVSDSPPSNLGVTAAGTGVEASRFDHVHKQPTAAETPSTPVGGVAATNVQAAIQELDAEKQNAATAVQKDSNTGVAKIPTGNTAQRPASPVQGDFRRNSELGRWEGYTGSQWDGIGGGQMYGLAQVKGIFYNAQIINENVTVRAGENGGSFGPISVGNGFTVTVENGSVWSIV